MRREKILMFGWQFPPDCNGGLGVACFGLSNALSEEGAKVIFVLPRETETSPALSKIVFANKALPGGVSSEILSGYITTEKYSQLTEKVKSFYGNTLFDEVMYYARRAANIALSENPDIIHAHDWLSFLAGVEAKRVTGKPLVLHMHATEVDRTGGQGVNEQVYAIEKSAMSKADSIIAVSNLTKEKIVKHYGVSPDKIDVVHNGIDGAEFKTTAPIFTEVKDKYKQKVVLSLGRITIQKGLGYFVQAAKKVLEYYPNTLFIISGSGDMQEQMMDEAASLGVGDKVIFTGFASREDSNALYQAADLFVLPSVSEPFGMTPLEAIIKDTPVLVSKQSGVSEVLSNALKVDFWDIDEMANKIVGVLQNDSLGEVLVEESKKEVKDMSWKSVAKKVIDVYRKIK